MTNKNKTIQRVCLVLAILLTAFTITESISSCSNLLLYSNVKFLLETLVLPRLVLSSLLNIVYSVFLILCFSVFYKKRSTFTPYVFLVIGISYAASIGIDVLQWIKMEFFIENIFFSYSSIFENKDILPLTLDSLIQRLLIPVSLVFAFLAFAELRKRREKKTLTKIYFIIAVIRSGINVVLSFIYVFSFDDPSVSSVISHLFSAIISFLYLALLYIAVFKKDEENAILTEDILQNTVEIPQQTEENAD